MMRLLDWIKARFLDEDDQNELLDDDVLQPAVRARPPSERKSAYKPPSPRKETDVEYVGSVGGRIADGGPGKNVLIRNKYLREDTGTHETLKIVDPNLIEGEEESGADPYNTGRFDRSRSWDSYRNRK